MEPNVVRDAEGNVIGITSSPPPAPAPAPAKPSSSVSLRLSELNRAILESNLWKMRTMSARADAARRVFQRATGEFMDAEEEFLSQAAAFGIDTSRTFEWLPDGLVVYSDVPKVPSAPSTAPRIPHPPGK